jgi:hypothetical protein
MFVHIASCQICDAALKARQGHGGQHHYNPGVRRRRTSLRLRCHQGGGERFHAYRGRRGCGVRRASERRGSRDD